MQTLAEGKDAVLNFLEDEALERTDEKQGIYSLQRDDAGTLVLFIEGWTFIGAGTVSVGVGNLLEVVDGHITKVHKAS